MPDPFIHLQVHSEYSLTDGLLRIPELVTFARKQHMHSIALTDSMNLFAAVKFYQECKKQGIKPIIGCDINSYHTDTSAISRTSPSPALFRITLLARNQQGYQHLLQLVSQAQIQYRHTAAVQTDTLETIVSKTDQPVVLSSWLPDHADGLFALLPKTSDVGQQLLAGNTELASQYLSHWLHVFPKSCYLAVQRIGQEDDELYLEQALTLAAHHHCPVVAVNDAHFMTAEDYAAHEARVCIISSTVLTDVKRKTPYTPQQYLRTDQEMRTLFTDLPEVITNTSELAKMATLTLHFHQHFLPDYPVPANKTMEQLLEEQVQHGLTLRMQKLLPDTAVAPSANPHHPYPQTKIYQQRIQFELNIIERMGFAGYFLIVAEFIQWAKQHDIPVGPGRGSGAGSLVAYALGITDINPLDYDLLFERFLNPERISMPDFDIDFCVEGRDRVIQHVAKLYGKDAVGQIITFGTMAAKAVVRDVARVMGKPYGLGDRIAKLIPFAVDMTLQRAVEEEPMLAKYIREDEEAAEVMEMAYKLEGITRNVGTHAAGVVIAPDKLSNFTALYCDDQGNLITQYDKDDVETVGLIKFDFLGLKTLTIIKNTLGFVQEFMGKEIDIINIPLHDEQTFTLLQQGLTDAVFQLESTGMKEVIRDLQPNCFEDIIALVAMYRPGPMDLIPDYIKRKHGKQTVVYLHPLLEEILANTYGIALYQEQVMQIAQVMANYTLGQADILRRAMGKKKRDVMEEQRESFITGALNNQIKQETAEATFAMIEKFAGYGFNKSHAACYALIAYQTAWLKAHYAPAFFAAVLNADIQNTDKMVAFIQEVKRFGTPMIMPDVNRSTYGFTLSQHDPDQSSEQQENKQPYAIIFGLGAIKGIGKGPAEAIVSARNKSGNFTDLFDFCCQIHTEQLNKRVMQALIYSGALDSLSLNRASLYRYYEQALVFAGQRQQQQQSQNLSLFDFDRDTDPYAYQNHPATNLQPVPEWSKTQILDREKQVLGFYISGHPLECMREELAFWRIRPIRNIRHKIDDRLIAGLLVRIFRRRTKNGQDFFVMVLEDDTGSFELAIYPEVYQEAAGLLQTGKILIVAADIRQEWKNKQLRGVVKTVYSLTQYRMNQQVRILVHFHIRNMDQEMQQLQKLLSEQHDPEGTEVFICYQNQDGQEYRVKLGTQWRVQFSEALIQQLEEAFSAQRVQLFYF